MGRKIQVSAEDRMRLMSTSMQVASSLMQAQYHLQASKFTANQLKRNAKARFAQGTRQAYEEWRQGRIMISNARAAMGVSGGSTTDAGAVNQLAGIKAVTDFNARSAVFGGQSEAMGLREKAEATLLEGRAKALKASVSGLSKKDIKAKKGIKEKKTRLVQSWRMLGTSDMARIPFAIAIRRFPILFSGVLTVEFCRMYS
ncbi:MAG: hypothetical protein AB2777_21175 [Candidatus Thiodiazotropha endolucinida]